MTLGLPVLPVAIGGGVLALALAAAGVTIARQNDALVTARLLDKDRLAVIVGLRFDVADRDARINATAGREYGDAGQVARTCATDISTSFERGVAFGRVISHAKSPPSTSSVAAAGGLPGSGVVRDYAKAWGAGAFRPGAQPAPSGDLRPADR